MADRFYSVDKGEVQGGITEGSSTSSEDIELRIDLAPAMSREMVVIALENIKNHIMKGNWPPA